MHSGRHRGGPQVMRIHKLEDAADMCLQDVGDESHGVKRSPVRQMLALSRARGSREAGLGPAAGATAGRCRGQRAHATRPAPARGSAPPGHLERTGRLVPDPGRRGRSARPEGPAPPGRQSRTPCIAGVRDARGFEVWTGRPCDVSGHPSTSLEGLVGPAFGTAFSSGPTGTGRGCRAGWSRAGDRHLGDVGGAGVERHPQDLAGHVAGVHVRSEVRGAAGLG